MTDKLLIEASRNWQTLNQFLKDATEEECSQLLTMELEREPPRKLFASRIFSRLNKVRAARERKELKEKL